jgi:transcriptional regulator with XRE-family HTH domain
MARSGKYKTQRALAHALGTDGSLVGKWLNGSVKRINSLSHRRRLVIFLDTPRDYFTPIPKGDLIQQLEAEVADLSASVQLLLELSTVLAGQVAKLGGKVPEEMLSSLRQAVVGRRL